MTVRWSDGQAVSVLVLLAMVAGPIRAQGNRPPDRLTAGPTDTVNRLMSPEILQQHARTTRQDDAAIVQTIEHKIRCTCGCGLDVFTCRTTDFTCATSPAMHRLVMARLDSAMSAEQVVAAFEAQYGQSILMQPPRRGFNWAAYLMPFVALGVGVLALLWTMRRWIRRGGGTVGRWDSGTATPSPSPGPPVPPSPDLERLQRELEHFES